MKKEDSVKYEFADGQTKNHDLFLIIAVINDISSDEETINFCDRIISQKEDYH